MYKSRLVYIYIHHFFFSRLTHAILQACHSLIVIRVMQIEEKTRVMLCGNYEVCHCNDFIIEKFNKLRNVFRSNIAEQSADGAESPCVNTDHMTRKLGPLSFEFVYFLWSLFSFSNYAVISNEKHS